MGQSESRKRRRGRSARHDVEQSVIQVARCRYRAFKSRYDSGLQRIRGSSAEVGTSAHGVLLWNTRIQNLRDAALLRHGRDGSVHLKRCVAFVAARPLGPREYQLPAAACHAWRIHRKRGRCA